MSDDGLAPGKRLSEIRQQLGLSQRRAAELSGLTHSAISMPLQTERNHNVMVQYGLLRLKVIKLRMSLLVRLPAKLLGNILFPSIRNHCHLRPQVVPGMFR